MSAFPSLRIGTLKTILLGGSHTVGSISLLLMLAFLLVLPFQRFALMLYDRGATLTTLLAVGLFSLHMVSAARRWFSLRSALHYPEHFLILSVLSLNAGALFGVVAFALFNLSPGSISVTPKLLDELATQDSIAAAPAVDNSIRIIHLAEDIRRLLHVSPSRLGDVPPSITLPSPLIEGRYPTSYAVALPSSSIRVTVIDPEPSPSHYPGTDWGLEVTDGKTTFELHQLRQALADYPLGPYVVGYHINRALLDTLIAKREHYEASIWLPRHLTQLTLRPSAGAPPPYLFVYQELMALLASNPNYFAPTSLTARALYLAYGLFRFLFGALFLGLIVRSWAAQAPAHAP